MELKINRGMLVVKVYLRLEARNGFKRAVSGMFAARSEPGMEERSGFNTVKA